MRDLFDEFGFLHLIGDLRYDDVPGAVLGLFDLPLSAQTEAATAGFVGGQDRGDVLRQHAAGWKIRAGHVAQQVGGGRLRMADQVDRCGADFTGVMRRDGRRHADRDASSAIRQQIGKRTRQHDGFGVFAVIGRTEIDRVLADVGQHRGGDLGQPRFGVAHGGGVVAVDVAEIALAFHQRITRGEFLRHAHHGVVDRGVAMRMELAHHVADDARAFLESGAGFEPQKLHRVDQPAVHRLQPVAHIRQRARHDG